MIKNNYFSDNGDLMLAFRHLVDWDAIVKAYEGEDFEDARKFAETNDERLALAPSSTKDAVDFYEAILDSVGNLTGNEVSQSAQALDHEGLRFQNGKVTFPARQIELFNMFKEAGVLAYKFTREVGGLSLPATVQCFYSEITNRGDLSFGMALGLMGCAEIVVRYGTEEQAQKYVTKVAAGDYMGAMALTEPNYGSDLRNVQTKAVKQPDGTYKLTGTKRFISQGCGLGDNPCLIMTLARTGTIESGARGLSLFIVDSKDVEVGGIEHKMGILTSPTCELVYDETPGELVGEEGFGLTRYALGIMNDARVSVGALGVGMGTAAYMEAHKYASEREQFGRTIDQIPAVRKLLNYMEREVFAMRLLTIEAGYAIDLSLPPMHRMQKAGKSDREIRSDASIRYWDRLATLFTPMAKYYCSEGCVALASTAIQIHGGAGYTEEYDVARIYRDARISTVYEGTSQLQVVAMIGGLSAGMAKTGYLREYIEGEMKKFKASAGTRELLELFEKAVGAYKDIEDTTTRDMVAQEVCNIAIRFMNSMLYERALTRLPAENQDRVRSMAEAYTVDSIASCRADLYRIENPRFATAG